MQCVDLGPQCDEGFSVNSVSYYVAQEVWTFTQSNFRCPCRCVFLESTTFIADFGASVRGSSCVELRCMATLDHALR